MKLPAGIEKWGSGVLGVVSLLLIGNLVSQFRHLRPGSPHPLPAASTTARPQKSAKALAHLADDLSRYDPVVHVEVLQELNARPLPDADRNPFDFVQPPAPQLTPQQVMAAQATAPAPPPPPPPPPPILLKPMGFNELPGGVKEAFASVDDQVYVVHEGDVVASKYKILKITPSMITVQDASTNQTAELPIPQ